MRTLKLVICSIIFLLIYTASFSQTWLWAQGTNRDSRIGVNIAGYNFASNNEVATDKNGNVYSIGTWGDTMHFGSYTLVPLSDSNQQEMFLVKYDKNGNVKWLTGSRGYHSSSCSPSSVAADDSGHVYVTFTLLGQVKFGSFLVGRRDNHGSTFLLKFDTNGNVLWSRNDTSWGGLNGAAFTTCCCSNGYIYMGGNFGDTVEFGSYILTLANAITGAFLVKYDGNGNVLWARQSNSLDVSSEVYPVAMSADKKGNAFLTGSYQDSITFGSYKLTSLSSKTTENIFMVKYDGNGNLKWAKQSHSNSTSDNGIVAYGITNDGYGASYATGYFQGSLQFDSIQLSSSSATGAYTAFVVKYDSNGQAIWAQQTAGSTQMQGYSLASDANNHIYLAGTCFDDTDIAIGSFNYITNPSQSNTFVIEFDSGGNALCGSVYSVIGGNWSVERISIACTPPYIYISGGVFSDNVVFGPDTIFEHSSGYTPFVARWQGCGSTESAVPEVATQKNGLTVYPNPFNNYTTVLVSSGGLHYIELDDITGRKLQWSAFNGNQYELPAQGLAAGMYFVRAFDSGKNLIGACKIVVSGK